MKKFILYVDCFAAYNRADVMFEVEAKTEREALNIAQDIVYSDYTNKKIYLVRVYQTKRDKQTKENYLQRIFNIRSHGTVDIYLDGEGEIIPYTTEKCNGEKWYCLQGYYSGIYNNMTTALNEMRKTMEMIDNNA